MSRTTKTARGFTLVELMIVVAIVGVLAALAIYGVTRYMAYAKTAEAKNNLGAIGRAAAAAYERVRVTSQLLPAGASSDVIAPALCDSAAPVPASIAQVAGVKYQPDGADGQDYDAGTADAGWRCLGFRIEEPQLYQYWYTRDGQQAPNGESACASGCYAAEAQGDLDGDGTTSWFARTGTISASGALLASTTIFLDNEYE